MADKQIQDAMQITDEQFKSQNSQFLMEQSATFFIETVLEKMNEPGYDKEAEKQRLLENIKEYKIYDEQGQKLTDEWNKEHPPKDAKAFKKDDLIKVVQESTKK